jgi:hypothetical protein
MPAHLLLALLLASPAAPAPVETVQTYDLGRMTFEEATRLEGKPLRVSFVVSAWSWDQSGWRSSAVGEKKVSRSVHLRRLNKPCVCGQQMTFEGILRTRIFPAGIIDGKQSRQSFVIQLEQASSVSP